MLTFGTRGQRFTFPYTGCTYPQGKTLRLAWHDLQFFRIQHEFIDEALLLLSFLQQRQGFYAFRGDQIPIRPAE